MELKHLVQRFVYRIEPKPEGGFIARAVDPTVAPLEAPTREELQQKIQAKLAEALGEAFPGLKLPPLANKQAKFEVHVERKPGGGFAVHSEPQGASTVEPATQEKFDHFAEELLGFVDQHSPQLSQAIAAQAGFQDIKVFTNQKASVTFDASSALSGGRGLLPTQPVRTSDVKVQGVQLEATTIENGTFNNALLTNTPIMPEKSGIEKIFRFLLALLIIAVMMYFFLHRG